MLLKASLILLLSVEGMVSSKCSKMYFKTNHFIFAPNASRLCPNLVSLYSLPGKRPVDFMRGTCECVDGP